MRGNAVEANGRIENTADTMPVHQYVCTVHRELRALGRIVGHEPVLVRQPARRAPTTPTRLSSSSLWSCRCVVSASCSCAVSDVRRQAIESWIVFARAYHAATEEYQERGPPISLCLS